MPLNEQITAAQAANLVGIGPDDVLDHKVIDGILIVVTTAGQKIRFGPDAPVAPAEETETPPGGDVTKEGAADDSAAPTAVAANKPAAKAAK